MLFIELLPIHFFLIYIIYGIYLSDNQKPGKLKNGEFMKILKKLSLTLTITFFAQLFLSGCDSTSTQISLIQIAPESKTIKSNETVSIQVSSMGSDLTYNWKVNSDNSIPTTENKWTFGPESEGVYTVKVWASSTSGAISNTLESIITVQDDAVSVSATLNTYHLTDDGSVTLTISSSSSGLTYYYQLDNGSSTKMSSNSTSIAVSGNGSHTIKAWAVDGNDKKSNVVTLPSLYIGELPSHNNIKASMFWVGENASSDNGGITNVESAWDLKWGDHYGIEDDIDIARDKDFIPTSGSYKKTENPYYYALPYNDFTGMISETDLSYPTDGYGYKNDISSVIPWYESSKHNGSYSFCKNRWAMIIHNSDTAYAQWEDSGPYYYADKSYVFGSSTPKNNISPRAGIDLSPALILYFDVRWDIDDDGVTTVDWEFVDESEVPNGPWKRYITTQQVYWP